MTEEHVGEEAPIDVSLRLEPADADTRQALREELDRSFIVRFALVACFVECVAGLVALVVLGTSAYGQILDVISIAIAPFAALMGAMATYYFVFVRSLLSRGWLMRVVMLAMVGEFVGAVALLIALGTDSLDTVKNIFFYGVTPLTVIAGAFGSYYYAR
jgi:hypothetical protein